MKLATEDSKPVGSGRFRDHAQDPRGVLGMSFSSSLARSYEGWVAQTHGGTGWVESRASCSAGRRWKHARDAPLPTRAATSPLLSHSPVLLLKKWMSQAGCLCKAEKSMKVSGSHVTKLKSFSGTDEGSSQNTLSTRSLP